MLKANRCFHYQSHVALLAGAGWLAGTGTGSGSTTVTKNVATHVMDFARACDGLSQLPWGASRINKEGTQQLSSVTVPPRGVVKLKTDFNRV